VILCGPEHTQRYMSKTSADEATAISHALVANPYYAISFHPGLSGKHELPVTESQWIEANRKLLAKLGDEAYLRLLLDVLKDVDPATQHETELADMIEMHFGFSQDSR
jgi:hypothetical protein